jgi:hypothetical protein
VTQGIITSQGTSLVSYHVLRMMYQQ